MATSSMDELRGRIAAGEYSVESGEIAGEILTKFALVRRVTRQLMAEDEAEAGPDGPSRRRGASKPSARTRHERLS
jgi:hypothetical protein